MLKLVCSQVTEHNVLDDKRSIARMPRSETVLQTITHRAIGKRRSALNGLAGNHAGHAVLEVLDGDSRVDPLDILDATTFDARGYCKW